MQADLIATFPRRISDRPSLWVATSAYGHDQVARHGQDGLLPWLAEAGADGVEIRRELLPDGFADFVALGKACQAHGLAVVYSAADALWQDTAACPSVEMRLAEADALGAIAIKFSLGRYPPGDEASWSYLRHLMERTAVPLVMVENDQTMEGGTLEPLAAFLDDAEQAGCPLAMTFDIGNWRWTDSDAHEAARRLGRYVRYVHCKGTLTYLERPHACVPSDEELADWQPIMAQFMPDMPRAIEYPLQAPNPTELTRQELSRLARL